MNEKSLIKRDSLLSKIKNKIVQIINKIFKLPKANIVIKQEPKKQIDKETTLKLYKDLKNNKVSIESLSLDEIKILIKLADEEVNILKSKIENEITETKIAEGRIKYYQKRLVELKK